MSNDTTAPDTTAPVTGKPAVVAPPHSGVPAVLAWLKGQYALFILIGLFIVASFASDAFLSQRNLTNLSLQLSVIGSTMGTRDELTDLVQMCRVAGVRPQIDVELPLTEAREGFARMLEGRTNGKIVFTL